MYDNHRNKRFKSDVNGESFEDNSVIPVRGTDSSGQPIVKMKKQKACLTCRRAKLKCEIPVPGEPCKRCVTSGVECKFRTRTHDDEWQASVENRLNDMADKMNHMSQLLDNFFNKVGGLNETDKSVLNHTLPSPPTSNVTRKSSNNNQDSEPSTSSLVKNYSTTNFEYDSKPHVPLSPYSVPNHNTLSGASALLAQTHVYGNDNNQSLKVDNDNHNGSTATSGFLSILDELLDPTTDTITQSKPSNNTLNNSTDDILSSSVQLGTIFDNPLQSTPSTSSNSNGIFNPISSQNIMKSLGVGSLDPRPNVIKKGVVSQPAAENLIDFFHTNLSTQLFGFRVQIGHFPYLPEGKPTLTPLITGVICLVASERIPNENLRLPVGNLMIDLDDFSFKPAIEQANVLKDEDGDEDDLDLELGIGPEEIVAMCIASVFCDISTKPNNNNNRMNNTDSSNSSSLALAQVAFKWARGFLKTSMLSVPPQMTIGEACGYLPPRRQLGLENWLRLWLFTFVIESQASFYSNKPSKTFDPTTFCTLLLEASAPGHPADNNRDRQLVAHARICTLLRQIRQSLDSRDWLNASLTETRTMLDTWNEELEIWRRVNLPESALSAADQWPATSLTLFFLFARLYINQVALGDKNVINEGNDSKSFALSSERWRYATAAVKAAAQMLDAVAEEPLCSLWSLLPLVYTKMISLAAGVLLKSVHVLDKISPVVTVEQINVSVIRVAEILKSGAPGQSKHHLARATSASLMNQAAKLQYKARSIQL